MRSEKEKMLAGELYDCGNPQLANRFHEAKRIEEAYNHTDTADLERRSQLLDQLLGKKGKNVSIAPPFHVDYGENIYLGDYVEINMNCVFLDCNRITIGDHSGFGPGVHIYAVFHPLNPTERLNPDSNFWKSQSAPVTIGRNVWIGGGSIILPGVTIGDGSTIGAGSVVTKSIPSNVLAVGNPCRVIRSVLEDSKIEKE